MTENKLTLKHSTIDRRVLLITTCLLAITCNAFSQNLLSRIEIDSVESVYVDRPGDLYVLLKNSNLIKFDRDGKFLSQQNFPETPTLFDPRDGSRAFVYFQKNQHCSFYSEGIRQEYKIEPHYAIDPVLVCSSGDHQLWVLDRSDWSIKRINPSQSKVIAEAWIDQKQFIQNPDFTFLREYQNFLFAIEKNTGILVFNSLGTQIKKIAAPGVAQVNFFGEELYYKKDDKLVFYDLFDATEREIPINPGCANALLTDTRLFVVFKSSIEIFSKP